MVDIIGIRNGIVGICASSRATMGYNFIVCNQTVERVFTGLSTVDVGHSAAGHSGICRAVAVAIACAIVLDVNTVGAVGSLRKDKQMFQTKWLEYEHTGVCCFSWISASPS